MAREFPDLLADSGRSPDESELNHCQEEDDEKTAPVIEAAAGVPDAPPGVEKYHIPAM